MDWQDAAKGTTRNADSYTLLQDNYGKASVLF